MPPRTPAVPPARNASASSMQSPPASAEATSVIILSPVLARPGARPRSRCRSTSWGRPRCWASVAGRISPALATRRWSSKAIWMRSGCSSGSIYWVLPVSGWFPVPKPLSQIHRSTFLPLNHAATLISSVDWGLRKAEDGTISRRPKSASRAAHVVHCTSAFYIRSYFLIVSYAARNSRTCRHDCRQRQPGQLQASVVVKYLAGSFIRVHPEVRKLRPKSADFRHRFSQILRYRRLLILPHCGRISIPPIGFPPGIIRLEHGAKGQDSTCIIVGGFLADLPVYHILP